MQPPRKNDAWLQHLDQLVPAAQNGDEGALAALIEATKARLQRFLLFLTGDPPLAADLLQETYLYALEHLDQIQSPRAFLHWLFVVAKNKFIDHQRSRANRPYDSVESLDFAGVIETDHRELALEIRQALGVLSPEDRLLILLVDLEQHSYAQAAGILGVSESAVRSRLHRARAAFQEKFSEDETNRSPQSPLSRRAKQ